MLANATTGDHANRRVFEKYFLIQTNNTDRKHGQKIQADNTDRQNREKLRTDNTNR